MLIASPLLVSLALPAIASAARVVSLPLTKASSTSLLSSRDGQSSRLGRRASVVESLGNNFTSYLATATVGSPPQPITLVIDTGSSDVFVLSSQADQCTSVRLQEDYGPCRGGTFNQAASTSYKVVSRGTFKTSYVDQSGAAGDYFTDNFAIGSDDTTIMSLQMGLALTVTTGVGIMGIGYSANEASTVKYPSIIDQMVSQSIIQSKAYSLWLNDLESDSGQILFGGIDHAKYTAPLISVPVLPSTSGLYRELSVALLGLTLTNGPGGASQPLSTNSFPADVVLDSGTSFTYLPAGVVRSLVSSLNAVYDTYTDLYLVDCSILSSNPTMTFDFSFGASGPVIRVPVDELVIPYGSTTRRLPFADSCGLTILDASKLGVSLLGDTFLRSAYVVYDLQNNQIALANTVFNATTGDIVEIPASGGIPLATQTVTSVPSVSLIGTTVSRVNQPTTGLGGGLTTLTGRQPTSTTQAGSPTPASTAVVVASTVTVTAAAPSSTGAASRPVAPLPFSSPRGSILEAAAACFALIGGVWLLI